MTTKGSFCDGVCTVLLGQSYRFACAFSQVIKFRTFGFTAAKRSYVEDVRTIQREGTLDSFVVDNSADGEHLVYPPAFSSDDCAGEDLNTLLVALDDSAMNVDRIAYLEMRDIVPEALAFDRIQQFSFHAYHSCQVSESILKLGSITKQAV
jgi:hypothetical protein